MLIKSDNTPGEIELSFRKELGSINPYVCLIDVAMSFFSSHLNESNNEHQALKKEAVKHGHPKLYTDHLTFNHARLVADISSLALIQSKADSFCEKIQKHPCMNQDFKSEAKGDFLRKTIFVFLKSSYPKLTPSNPVKDEDFHGILDNNHVLLIDYYRTIRNKKLHGSTSNESLFKIFKKIDVEEINKYFGIYPEEPSKINKHDIILFSKVWQKVAKDIASSFINLEDHVFSILKKKYGNSSPQRRTNGARQYLKREFL
ncbi:hypothetical protein VU10_05735, partial [Desulfobulbus sp. US1]|nr:hypothetical protein [Desulfobulbus sp. US1]